MMCQGALGMTSSTHLAGERGASGGARVGGWVGACVRVDGRVGVGVFGVPGEAHLTPSPPRPPVTRPHTLAHSLSPSPLPLSLTCSGAATRTAPPLSSPSCPCSGGCPRRCTPQPAGRRWGSCGWVGWGGRVKRRSQHAHAPPATPLPHARSHSPHTSSWPAPARAHAQSGTGQRCLEQGACGRVGRRRMWAPAAAAARRVSCLAPCTLPLAPAHPLPSAQGQWGRGVGRAAKAAGGACALPRPCRFPLARTICVHPHWPPLRAAGPRLLLV